MRVWGRCRAVIFVLFIAAISVSGQDRVQYFLDAGLREYHAGNFSAAKTLYGLAMDAARASGNEDLEAVISNDLGNAEIGVDQPQRASEAYNRALAILRRKPEEYFELAATLRNLASANSLQGNYDEALRLLKEAGKTLVSRPESEDSQLLMAEILNSQGIVLVQQGKFAKAQPLFEQAINTRAASGVREGLGDAQTISNIGVISRFFTDLNTSS